MYGFVAAWAGPAFATAEAAMTEAVAAVPSVESVSDAHVGDHIDWLTGLPALASQGHSQSISLRYT